MARLLVACEYSGVVRDAFLACGVDAVSCDLLPTERPGPHLQADVRDVLSSERFDAIIAFPPCTDLCVSGARWFAAKRADGRQAAAVAFFLLFVDCSAPVVAIENPVGIMSTVYRKPDQIIHPWMFGHGETKATCLWLRGLPPLAPSNIVAGRDARVHRMAPGPGRSKARSLTYRGVADAMAAQWCLSLARGKDGPLGGDPAEGPNRP